MRKVVGFENERFEMSLSRRELNLIRACLLEAWEALDDHAFLARTGFERSDADDMWEVLTSQGKQALAEWSDSGEGEPSSDG